MTVEAFAPAKINLTLHITGQREDGYHLLDSLVMFADVGDVITVEKAKDTTLTITGPMADGVPTDRSNLIWRAADLLGVSAKISLEKHLPAAAGIGGGSSDAAATIRALTSLYGLAVPSTDALLTLGADVPVCMSGSAARMRGIGEKIDRISKLNTFPMILINPRVAVPTAKVFAAVDHKTTPPMPAQFPDMDGHDAALLWIAAQRNDLEAPARDLQPVIATALRDLRDSEGCQLARMSGSGATCFGIYASIEMRDRALLQLRRDHPKWWIAATQQVGTKFC